MVKKPKQKKTMLPPWEKLGLRETCSTLIRHLATAGMESMITGAACAAFYAPAQKPKGIDIVVTGYHVEKVVELMRLMGYRPLELRSFSRPAAPFEVTFHPAPAVVGDEPVEKFKTVSVKGVAVKLLTPTDCVRQRLAAWYQWGDEDAFHHAVAVARRQAIDQVVVKRWSEWEWSEDKYREFLTAVASH